MSAPTLPPVTITVHRLWLQMPGVDEMEKVREENARLRNRLEWATRDDSDDVVDARIVEPPPVNGHCPSCGAETLTLADGGQVSCGSPLCEEPAVADRFLSFGADGYDAAEAQSLRDTNTELSRRSADLTRTIDDLLMRNDSQLRMIATFRADVAAKVGRIRSMEAALDEHDGQASEDLRTQRTELAQRVVELTEERNRLLTAVADTRQDVINAEQCSDRLSGELRELRELRSDYGDLAARHADVVAERDRVMREQNSWAGWVDRLRSERDDAQGLVQYSAQARVKTEQTSQAEIDRLTRELAGQRADTASGERDAERLKRELDALSEAAPTIRAEKIPLAEMPRRFTTAYWVLHPTGPVADDEARQQALAALRGEG